MPPLFIAIAPTVRFEVELFCVMRLTFDPTPPLINTLPEPLPELVIVPVLFTVLEIVMPLAPVLLFLRVRLPVPVMPPEWVKTVVPLFTNVSPPELSVVAPVIFTVPAPVPLVTVTAFTPWVIAPERVKGLLTVSAFSARLLFRARAPLKVGLLVTAIIDNVPVEPACTVMLFVYVPAEDDASVALLLPVVSPSAIAPVPKFEDAAVPMAVPLLIVTAPEKVLAWLREAVPV